MREHPYDYVLGPAWQRHRTRTSRLRRRDLSRAERALWRWYLRLQPIRCLLGRHDWYATAAGLCAACASSRCDAEVACPPSVARFTRDPVLRRALSIIDELETAQTLYFDEYLRLAKELAEARDQVAPK